MTKKNMWVAVLAVPTMIAMPGDLLRVVYRAIPVMHGMLFAPDPKPVMEPLRRWPAPLSGFSSRRRVGPRTVHRSGSPPSDKYSVL